ncbi:MAG: glycine cleavage system protein GcvH [Candidatus Hydrothermae bacterium]|nr:glycine cleavage system protein GcvH [Candidatus Hydrothermae bacterium]
MSNVPGDRKYTEDHEWVKDLGNGNAEIGITDYAQAELSDIVYVELPAVGKEVRKGDVLATLEAVKTVADVYAPIDGVVVEVNTSLENAPETINNDPYGQGWIVRLQMHDSSQLNNLLSPEQYQKLIGDTNPS